MNQSQSWSPPPAGVPCQDLWLIHPGQPVEEAGAVAGAEADRPGDIDAAPIAAADHQECSPGPFYGVVGTAAGFPGADKPG